MSTAGTIKLRHQTAIVNNPSYDISKNVINDSMVVAGGVNGEIVVRDTGQTDGWGTSPLSTLISSITSLALTSISLGTNPSTTGAARFANAVYAMWRNAANNTDLFGIGIDATDQLFLGNSTSHTLPGAADNVNNFGSAARRWASGFFGTVVQAPKVQTGTTSGDVMWKKSGTVWQARLGDDSGFCDLTADTINANSLLRFGTNFAGVGNVRGPASFQIAARDNANANNRSLVDWGASATDTLLLGDSNALCIVQGSELAGDPSAPATNGWKLYAKDNGGGKTQLMVIFASGAAQQVAIQP